MEDGGWRMEDGGWRMRRSRSKGRSLGHGFFAAVDRREPLSGLLQKLFGMALIGDSEEGDDDLRSVVCLMSFWFCLDLTFGTYSWCFLNTESIFRSLSAQETKIRETVSWVFLSGSQGRGRGKHNKPINEEIDDLITLLVCEALDATRELNGLIKLGCTDPCLLVSSSTKGNEKRGGRGNTDTDEWGKLRGGWNVLG